MNCAVKKHGCRRSSAAGGAYRVIQDLCGHLLKVSDSGVLRPVVVPVLIVLFVTTFLVMAVSGRVTQALLRRREKKEDEHG